jgi:protein TonB
VLSTSIHIAFLTLLTPLVAVAQIEKIYTVSDVNTKPTPTKGISIFYDQWKKKVLYPEQAIEKKVQGLVFIQFVVNEHGVISEASVKAGLGYGCDEAALKGFMRVATAPWKPGIKNSEPVPVKMVLPFSFRIIDRR